MIYEPDIECASPQQLTFLQAKALREYLTTVGQRIPEYRARIAGSNLDQPDRILDDHELLEKFAAIGVTDADVYCSIDGSALRAIGSDLYYLETTSGTTSVPKARYVTWGDDLLDQRLVARSFCAFGVNSRDRILTVDLGDVNFYALMIKGLARLGVYDSVFYCARQPFADSMQEALSCKPTVLVTIPSILMRALPSLKESLRATPSLKKLVYYCEALNPAFQEYLTREFGIESFSLYSAIEVGMIGAECSAHNGIHLWADVLLPIISGAAAVENETSYDNGEDSLEGLLGLTTLLHRGKPTLAYLIGDRVRYSGVSCSCGRTLPRIHFLERESEIFGIFGAKFTYRQIYECIYGTEEGSGFLQIVLDDDSIGTTMKLILPLAPAVEHEERVDALTINLTSQAGLSHLLDHRVLRFEFEFVPGEFFTKRKIRRVEDLRNASLQSHWN